MSAPLIGEDWEGRLASLGQGWDCEGSPVISSAAIEAVKRFAVVPRSNGGIQLEIHKDGYDIEICIGPDGKIDGALVAHDS